MLCVLSYQIVMHHLVEKGNPKRAPLSRREREPVSQVAPHLEA
mgnify:CR=1